MNENTLVDHGNIIFNGAHLERNVKVVTNSLLCTTTAVTQNSLVQLEPTSNLEVKEKLNQLMLLAIFSLFPFSIILQYKISTPTYLIFLTQFENSNFLYSNPLSKYFLILVHS